MGFLFSLECLERKGEKGNAGSVPGLLLLFWSCPDEEPFLCPRLRLLLAQILLWLEGRGFEFREQFNNGNCPPRWGGGGLSANVQ